MIEEASTLVQFLHASRPSVRGSRIMRAHVTSPGFEILYVRRWERSIGGVTYPDVLDIADIKAAKPGSGAFSALVEALHRAHLGLTLRVENVIDLRFQNKLVRLGFRKTDAYSPTPSFYLPSTT